MLVSAVILGLLLTQLPSIPMLVGGNQRAREQLTVSAQLDELLLTAAGMVVWLLVAWLGLLISIAVITRVVGGTEAGTAVVLRFVAPRAVRGVLITALGIGSVGALSACAPSAIGDPGVVASVSNVTAQTAPTWSRGDPYDADWPTTESAPVAGGVTVDLDWPSVVDQSLGSAAEEPIVSEPVVAEPSAAEPTGTEPAATEPAVSEPVSAEPAVSEPAAVPDAVVPDAVVPDAAEPDPGPASASDAPADQPPIEPPTELPTDPRAAAAPASSTPAAAPAAAQVVTVRAGDSLWSIAADHLGPKASDADIAASWPQWYAANRALIGDDPALILPGWQLVTPPATPDHTDSGARP